MDKTMISYCGQCKARCETPVFNRIAGLCAACAAKGLPAREETFDAAVVSPESWALYCLHSGMARFYGPDALSLKLTVEGQPVFVADTQGERDSLAAALKQQGLTSGRFPWDSADEWVSLKYAEIIGHRGVPETLEADAAAVKRDTLESLCQRVDAMRAAVAP
jgi:hypothetical protein